MRLGKVRLEVNGLLESRYLFLVAPELVTAKTHTDPRLCMAGVYPYNLIEIGECFCVVFCQKESAPHDEQLLCLGRLFTGQTSRPLSNRLPIYFFLPLLGLSLFLGRQFFVGVCFNELFPTEGWDFLALPFPPYRPVDQSQGQGEEGQKDAKC